MSKNTYKIKFVEHSLWNLLLYLIILILVAYNCFVFFIVSKHCEIGCVGEYSVTGKEIIMFNDYDALDKHKIS